MWLIHCFYWAKADLGIFNLPSRNHFSPLPPTSTLIQAQNKERKKESLIILSLYFLTTCRWIPKYAKCTIFGTRAWKVVLYLALNIEGVFMGSRRGIFAFLMMQFICLNITLFKMKILVCYTKFKNDFLILNFISVACSSRCYYYALTDTNWIVKLKRNKNWLSVVKILKKLIPYSWLGHQSPYPTLPSVWPDLAKFHHFCQNLN